MSQQFKILVVDDDPLLCQLMTDIISGMGYPVKALHDPHEAIKAVQEENIPVALIDLKLPGMDGIEVMEEIKAISPGTIVIIVTGHSSIETAVDAMRRGAWDYVTKPFGPDAIEALVEKAFELQTVLQQGFKGFDSLDSEFLFTDMVGRSPAMIRLKDSILKAATSHSTVLITGQTGTGKELIARAIHRNSSRHGKPFIPVDCAAIPDNLLESTFFGHEKGAFTGAMVSKIGMAEFADGGTLFLDEIGELPVALQSKLLRLLQERCFRRVGGNVEIEIDIRIITATNRDLEKLVQQNLFREDLYYRLRVLSIEVPSLRERNGDIVMLAKFFLDKYSKLNEKAIVAISPDALDKLLGYNWPGNVRELEHAIEQAAVFCSGDTIMPEDLPIQIRRTDQVRFPEAVEGVRFAAEGIERAGVVDNSGGNSGGQADQLHVTGIEDIISANFKCMPLKEYRDIVVKVAERIYAEKLLELNNGNVTAAAREAGISRRSFYRLLDRVRK